MVALAGDHTWLTVGPCLACSALGAMSISPAPLGEVVTCLGGLPNMCISTAGRMLCGEASTDCSVLMKRVVVQASVPRVASCAPDSQAHRFYVMCDLCVWRWRSDATLARAVLFTCAGTESKKMWVAVGVRFPVCRLRR